MCSIYRDGGRMIAALLLSSFFMNRARNVPESFSSNTFALTGAPDSHVVKSLSYMQLRLDIS